METTETLAHELIERRSNRRAAMMLGGAALAGMAFARPRTAAAQSTTLTDGDILNFALNLEYLEAQFYTLATAGTTIDKLPTNPVNVNGGGGGTGGTVTVKPNFAPVPFTTGVLQDYANETAQEERNHVSFLSGALATAAVAQPNLDLYNSFNALAQVAGLGPSFDPFASETNFLLGAFIFEDVGVTAYNGAATLLTSQAYLQAAAGILAVEAYHAGSIRTRIYAAGAGAQSASQLIASARASLSAAALTTPPSTPDDLGVSTLSNGAATIVDADANAITFSRTAAQVLSIVYGGSKPGVFYPNGLNGTIK